MCISINCTCMFMQYLSMIIHDYLWHEPNFVISKVWMVSTFDFWVGGLLFESCVQVQGEWLTAMLALFTGKGVSLEVNLREHNHIHLHKVLIRLPTLALKLRGKVTKVQNRGVSGPTNEHVSNKKFKKSMKMYFYGWKYLLFCVLDPSWYEYQFLCFPGSANFCYMHCTC